MTFSSGIIGVEWISGDDPSFDRATFHRKFNKEVVAFFKKTLIA